MGNKSPFVESIDDKKAIIIGDNLYVETKGNKIIITNEPKPKKQELKGIFKILNKYGRYDYFIQCEDCKFKRARIRLRTQDMKCPNCGFNRELTEIEKDTFNKMKQKSTPFTDKEKNGR